MRSSIVGSFVRGTRILFVVKNFTVNLFDRSSPLYILFKSYMYRNKIHVITYFLFLNKLNYLLYYQSIGALSLLIQSHARTVYFNYILGNLNELID